MVVYLLLLKRVVTLLWYAWNFRIFLRFRYGHEINFARKTESCLYWTSLAGDSHMTTTCFSWSILVAALFHVFSAGWSELRTEAKNSKVDVAGNPFKDLCCHPSSIISFNFLGSQIITNAFWSTIATWLVRCMQLVRGQLREQSSRLCFQRCDDCFACRAAMKSLQSHRVESSSNVMLHVWMVRPQLIRQVASFFFFYNHWHWVHNLVSDRLVVERETAECSWLGWLVSL